MTTLALLYTALVTPVEVAFIASPAPSEVYTNSLFLTNRLVDLIFIFDMLLCFRLAVRVTGSDGTRWLHSPRAIARNYVTSKWFSLDLFSVCTSIFDFPIFGDNAGASDKLIVLRAVRVLRLAKLVRLARGSRLLKRWEMVTALPLRASAHAASLLASAAAVENAPRAGCMRALPVAPLTASF